MDKVYKITGKDLDWTTAEAETTELVIWYDLGQLQEELYGVARQAIQQEQQNAYFRMMEEQFGLCWSAQPEIDRFRLRVQLDFRKRQTDLKLVVTFVDPLEIQTGCLEHIHIKIVLVIFGCEFIQNIGLSHLSGPFQLQHKSRIPPLPVNQFFINIPLQIHCSASCSVCSYYIRSCKFPQQLRSHFLRKEVLRY